MPRNAAASRSVKVKASEGIGRLSGGKGRSVATAGQEGHKEEQATAELNPGKAMLLGKKRKELEAVVDRHDTLVREMFHMEYFLMMLDYNPKEAKQDNTQVFQNFKSRFDLVDNLPASTRPTRSSRTEKLQMLQPAKPTRSFVHLASPSDTRKKSIRGISVNPGKLREPLILSNATSISHPPKLQTSVRASDVVPVSLSIGSRLRQTKIFPQEPLDLPPPRKRQKVAVPVSEDSLAKKRNLRSRHSVSGAKQNGRAEDTIHLFNRQQHPITGAQSVSAQASPSSPTKIKRIRLLVRRPLPLYTNPRQRPPEPKFNKSLSAFMQSYTSLNDQDFDEEILQKQANADIALLRRVDEFKKQGRFIPGADIFVGPNATSAKAASSPERTEQDHWDHVIAEVVERRNAMLKQTPGRQIAAQIAAKIKVYWEVQVAKRDKMRQQEEKRLRGLAKATIKIVTNEWKKAVFYIREQERLKREAEERKRGHEHLDAILDQSGQILETQHLDLSRADRSRTSSVSWGSQGGDSDEEQTDSELDDEVDGADESVVSEGADADEGSEPEDDATLMLLGGRTSIVETTPSYEPPEAEDEWENDIPNDSSDRVTQDLLNPSSPLRSPSSRSTTPMAGVFPAQIPPRFTNDPENITKADSSGLPASDPAISEFDFDLETIFMSKSRKNSTPILDNPPDALTNGNLMLEFPSSDQDTLVPSSMTKDADDDLEMAVDGRFDVNGVADTEQRSEVSDEEIEEISSSNSKVPHYLKPFAVAPVEWDTHSKITPPSLLRGVLRPYQQSGLEWLASLHTNNLNGILADEMGLGKTIQTISLLAHLACDRGIWGPHLIVVPTSVLLNWEMEFKKFLPGFRVLAYHGTTKRRKELRQGWNDKFHFNVCITSYALASRDAHIFKRKAWYYMVLDEAHMIKNFKSQRWNILLMFRSFRRLLLTGTPLQNNLTELWALLQFLMSGSHFANLKEFADWFSNPLEKAIEAGDMLDEETLQRVSKLHTVLRPYLLRRIKRDVEKELPSKFEHVILCPLSKRQRFLYDEFMSRAQTRDALQSGVYQKIANILMQLRKVCNHPDLFEVRPITTSFAMERSAIADFEIKDLLLRRRLLADGDEDRINMELLGLHFLGREGTSQIGAMGLCRLDASPILPHVDEDPGVPPPADYRTISGFSKRTKWMQRARIIAKWCHISYVNRLRCNRMPIYSAELLSATSADLHIVPIDVLDRSRPNWEVVRTTNWMVQSYKARAASMSGYLERFAFVTPAVVAPDVTQCSLAGAGDTFKSQPPAFDDVLHQASVKLQIAFPDPSLLQYDCGKLQTLTNLLREKKAGGHRVLIFTQMTRVLDILEMFLNFNGHLYLRLDGATKIEDRQYITERFNADPRIFAFIASSRSGGVGINLTGADTVIFYDSDFNPQMDKQCEDRAHRIGQIRDVHIYRLVSQHTVEEALLRKANQKRSLDDLVIQKGEFDWRTLFKDENALSKALEEFEDTQDVHAAAVAAREEFVLEGADEADFGADAGDSSGLNASIAGTRSDNVEVQEERPEEDEGGTVAEYMVLTVERDWDHFKDWRV